MVVMLIMKMMKGIKKIEKIISLNPDFIHVGVCCKTKNNGEYCSTVKNMIKYFEHHNITIIDGTH